MEEKTVKNLRRIMAAICLLTIMATMFPTAFAAYGPGPDDLKGCNKRVQYPDWDSWLDSYETKYLKTRHGVRAYLRYEPTSDSGYYDYVYEKAKVTVLARENGYSLVKTTDGMAGWVTSSLLYDSYPGNSSSGNSGSKNTGSPGPDDLRGCNSKVEYPGWNSWLDSYETKYVKTKHGVRAYLRYEPTSNSGYYDYVYEKAKVTVLARENGYSLVKTNDGMAGWVTSSVLVSKY